MSQSMSPTCSPTIRKAILPVSISGSAAIERLLVFLLDASAKPSAFLR